MSNIKTFTITGYKGDGNGGASTTLFAADCEGGSAVIAALTGQYKVGETYTRILSDPCNYLFNGQRADYMVGPDC